MLDAATGAAGWQGPGDTYALATTADTVLGRAGNGRGDLVAVDAGGGAERWRLDLPDHFGGPQTLLNREHAAAGDAFVLTITMPSDEAMLDGRVTVIDARTGTMRWSAPVGENLIGAGADGVVTSPGSRFDDRPNRISYFPLA